MRWVTIRTHSLKLEVLQLLYVYCLWSLVCDFCFELNVVALVEEHSHW